LLFHCYGNTCYLAQVWQGANGGDRSLHVPATRRERTFSFATRSISITIPAEAK
jgi:hypothetical protein